MKSPENAVENLLMKTTPKTIWENHVFSVGGYVRDEILGLIPKDLDIVIDVENGAKDFTRFLKSKFGDAVTNPVNMGNYPIWQITFKKNVFHDGIEYFTEGAVIEFADTMREDYPDENSRQRNVKFASIEEDVKRRDFTCNSVMKNLSSGKFVDLSGTGISDIKKGILRGHPNVDFNEILRQDALRSMRLVRFICKYDWTTPLSVLKAVKKNAYRIQTISNERIRDELIKIMKFGKLAKAIKFFDATGLLPYIFPEINELKKVEQNPIHHQEGSAYVHTLMVLKHTGKGVILQLAALFHDVGKLKKTEIINGEIHSYEHEKASEEMTDLILRRMKFDTIIVSSVKKLVKNHMRPHKLFECGKAGIRRFIRDMDESLEDVLNLSEADELGKIPQGFNIPVLRQRIEQIKSSKIPVRRQPILNGNEIMEILKIRPSKQIKDIQNSLLALEDQKASENVELTKDDAISFVREFPRTIGCTE